MYNRDMKKTVIIFVVIIGVIAGVLFFLRRDELLDPIGKTVEKVTEKPLEKYSFERLRASEIPLSNITIGKLLKDDEDFASFEFSYSIDKNLIILRS